MTNNSYENEHEELIHWFKTQRLEMWNELSESEKLTEDEKNLFKSLYNLRRINVTPTLKQLRWAKSIIEKVEENQRLETKRNLSNSYKACHHLTVRIAWHDNGWNGEICKNPELNVYCNGEHSLLSRRIRERKPDNCDNNTGKSFSEIRMNRNLPPCYWCINITGANELQIEHDNPAAPHIQHIHETLPPPILYFHGHLSYPLFEKIMNQKDTANTFLKKF